MKKILPVLMCLAMFTLIFSGCGSDKSDAPDPEKLLIGSWSNEEAGVLTTFREDGTYTTKMNGEIVLEDTYTTEKVDDYSITVSTGEGEVIQISFPDENTLTSEDTTMLRVTQDESIPENEDAGESDSSLADLLIGTWAVDNSVMEFDANGYAYIYEDGEESDYTYELSPIDDSSITITLIDADGSTSSETAVFYDADTLGIGDIVFVRSVG